MTLNPYYDEIARPLGHVLIEFNELEVALGRLIARLLKQDDLVGAVFTTQSFSTKLTLARQFAVFKVSDAELLNEIEEALSEAAAVNTERNRYVHSEYLAFLDANDTCVEVLHSKLRDRPKLYSAIDGEEIDTHMLVVSAAALEGLVDRINAVALRVRALAERYTDLHP